MLKLVIIDLNENLREGSVPAMGTERFPHEVAEAAVRLELRARGHGDAKIFRDRNGKPQTDIEGFYFNVTHTRGLVACAFSDAPVGVDAEFYAERNFLPIAERFFSAEEVREIKEAEAPLRAFYRLWTAKESLIKREGGTLAAGLKTACGARLAETATFELSRGLLIPFGTPLLPLLGEVPRRGDRVSCPDAFLSPSSPRRGTQGEAPYNHVMLSVVETSPYYPPPTSFRGVAEESRPIPSLSPSASHVLSVCPRAPFSVSYLSLSALFNLT